MPMQCLRCLHEVPVQPCAHVIFCWDCGISSPANTCIEPTYRAQLSLDLAHRILSHSKLNARVNDYRSHTTVTWPVGRRMRVRRLYSRLLHFRIVILLVYKRWNSRVRWQQVAAGEDIKDVNRGSSIACVLMCVKSQKSRKQCEINEIEMCRVEGQSQSRLCGQSRWLWLDIWWPNWIPEELDSRKSIWFILFERNLSGLLVDYGSDQLLSSHPPTPPLPAVAFCNYRTHRHHQLTFVTTPSSFTISWSWERSQIPFYRNNLNPTCMS